jgi:ribosomal protein S25
MAKKKGKKETEQKAKPRSITEQALLDVAVPEDLYKRSSREIKSMEYITPFTLSQKLGVSISTSKKIIRRLSNEGLLILYSPGRRSPVYVRKE